MAKQKQGKKTKQAKGSGLKSVEESLETYPARVLDILGTLGTRGGYQVRCRVLEGRDKNKVMRRNVIGPVRKDDILMLKQTEIEASPLKGGRK